MAGGTERIFDDYADSRSFFSRLSRDQKADLAHSAIKKSIPARQVIVSVGEPIEGIYLITSGGLRLESFAKNGDRFITGTLQQGDVFGLLATLDRHPSMHCVSAVSDTQCYFIPGNRFRQFVYGDPELMQWMLESLCRRFRMSLVLINRFAPGSLASRVARCLVASVESVGALGDPAHPIRITIAQSDIAAMLSVSRQSVNKSLKTLESEGIIEIAYNEITIINLPALHAFA